jgi:protein-disulfide isomerase
MEISGGRIKLDVSQWPAIGNQEADFVCVEMFDYNCQHCRQTHSAIKAAREKMGDKMAVILLPVPLNTNCNNQIVQTGPQFVESCLLTKLAISVWKVNPQKFDEFHEWMFEGFNAPSYQTALAQAEKMVGKDELAKVLDSPLPDAYIQKHVQIYSLIGKGNVPKLLFRTTSIEGMFQSPDLLIDILNRQGPLVPTEVPAAAKAETEKK